MSKPITRLTVSLPFELAEYISTKAAKEGVSKSTLLATFAEQGRKQDAEESNRLLAAEINEAWARELKRAARPEPLDKLEVKALEFADPSIGGPAAEHFKLLSERLEKYGKCS